MHLTKKYESQYHDTIMCSIAPVVLFRATPITRKARAGRTMYRERN